jgi:hypothetical protein
MLPQDWERRLVDVNVEELWPDDIEWADMVFVSAMFVQSESLEKVVELCRSMGKKVVVGGRYVSTSFERLPDADHIFIGEAEMTLPEFIHDVELGITRKIYQAAERSSLANTPLPDFGLIDMSKYSAIFDFHSAKEVWNEVRAVWKAAAGITYDRIEQDGLQWPCFSEDDPGTQVLHVGGFEKESAPRCAGSNTSLHRKPFPKNFLFS